MWKTPKKDETPGMPVDSLQLQKKLDLWFPDFGYLVI